MAINSWIGIANAIGFKQRSKGGNINPDFSLSCFGTGIWRMNGYWHDTDIWINEPSSCFGSGVWRMLGYWHMNDIWKNNP